MRLGCRVAVDETLEVIVRRDRLVVVTALTAVIALAWVYLLAGAGMGMSAVEMTRQSQSGMVGGMATMTPTVWTPYYAGLMFFMWWIMMVAMMLPSAAPMILLFSAVNRRQRERGDPFVPTGIFAVGYLAAWAGFSVAASGVHWAFEQAGLLSALMTSTSTRLSAAVLIVAGGWQLTPLKHACLRHCRSPMHYLSHHWRRGRRGAFRMGVNHGAYCLGCCWFLMALLFYGGVMNLYWISGLALYVLLEKTIPYGHWLGSITGVALLFVGVALLFGFIAPP
jgi:predicted metal-binding membrane protein